VRSDSPQLSTWEKPNMLFLCLLNERSRSLAQRRGRDFPSRIHAYMASLRARSSIGEKSSFRICCSRGLSTARPTDYENTGGTCGVLKAFYLIRFFHRLQGWSFICCVFDLTRSDPSIITISLHSSRARMMATIRSRSLSDHNRRQRPIGFRAAISPGGVLKIVLLKHISDRQCLR